MVQTLTPTTQTIVRPRSADPNHSTIGYIWEMLPEMAKIGGGLIVCRFHLQKHERRIVFYNKERGPQPQPLNIMYGIAGSRLTQCRFRDRHRMAGWQYKMDMAKQKL